MRIPLHNLFDEAFGLSKITDKKQLEELVMRLRKEGNQMAKENPDEINKEMEARRFEE